MKRFVIILAAGVIAVSCASEPKKDYSKEQDAARDHADKAQGEVDTME